MLCGFPTAGRVRSAERVCRDQWKYSRSMGFCRVVLEFADTGRVVEVVLLS